VNVFTTEELGRTGRLRNATIILVHRRSHMLICRWRQSWSFALGISPRHQSSYTNSLFACHTSLGRYTSKQTPLHRYEHMIHIKRPSFPLRINKEPWSGQTHGNDGESIQGAETQWTREKPGILSPTPRAHLSSNHNSFCHPQHCLQSTSNASFIALSFS
jgi:hypothetical protein